MINRYTILAFLLITALSVAYAAELEQKWSQGDGLYRNGSILKGFDITSDRSVIYTLDDKFLKEWDPATGKSKRCKRFENIGDGPTLSSDGKYILLSSELQLLVLDVKTWNVVYTHKFEMDTPGAFACIGDTLVVGTKERKLWKGKIGVEDSWEAVETERAWDGLICDIAVAPDGKIAICGGNTIRVYSSEVKYIWEKKFDAVGLFASHFIDTPIKRWLVGTAIRETYFFDPDTGEVRSKIANTTHVMGSGAYDSKLALGLRNNKMVVYDLSQAIMESDEWDTGEAIYHIAFLNDREIAGFSLIGNMYRWDLRGRKISGPSENAGTVNAAAFGRLAGGSGWLAVSHERGIKTYRWPDGTPLPAADGYKRNAMRIRDAGNGKMLCIFFNRTITVFDVDKGIELDSFTTASTVIDAYLQSDGKPVYLGSDSSLHRITLKEDDKGIAEEEITKYPSFRYWLIDNTDGLLLGESSSHSVVMVSTKTLESFDLGTHPTMDGVGRSMKDIDVYGDTIASISGESLVFWSKDKRGALSDAILLDSSPLFVELIDAQVAAVAFPDGRIEVYRSNGTRIAEWSDNRPITWLEGGQGGIMAGMRDGASIFFEIK